MKENLMNPIAWHTYKCQTIKCLLGLCATVTFILVLTSSPMLSQWQFRINYIWKEHIVNHFYMISTLHQGPCRVLFVWPWFISHTYMIFLALRYAAICLDALREIMVWVDLVKYIDKYLHCLNNLPCGQ